ncbi:MAG: hypothetical protein ABUS54_04555 [Actinomycetota bacterium]
MPVESQSRAPLGSRDKKLLAVLGALVVAGGVTGAVVYHGESSGTNCLVVDLPSTVGGAHLTRCGDAAVTFCRTESKHDRIVAQACRREGFAVTGKVR